jgi:hypothetical protein
MLPHGHEVPFQKASWRRIWKSYLQLKHAYTGQFFTLSRYATHQMDTDAKKRERFLPGLNPDLKERLVLNSRQTFNDLISATIKVEDAMQQA